MSSSSSTGGRGASPVPAMQRAGTTFLLLHRTGCSAAAAFVEVEPEFVESVADRLSATQAGRTESVVGFVPRACYHLICSRQYKLGLTDRSAENAALWSGALIRVSLVYRDDGEQVLHAFLPNGSETVEPSPGTKRKKSRQSPSSGEEKEKSKENADVGPLLRFQPGVTQPGGKGNFRNAIACREVLLRMGGEGESVGSFGFVATSFCHRRRAFALKMEIEEGLPQLAVAGRLEFTTRTHHKGRTLGLAVFGLDVPESSQRASSEGGDDSSDEGGPEGKRQVVLTGSRGPLPPLAGLLDYLVLTDGVLRGPPPRVFDISEIGSETYPNEELSGIIRSYEAAARETLEKNPAAAALTSRFEEHLPGPEEGAVVPPEDPLGPLVTPRGAIAASPAPALAVLAPSSLPSSAADSPIWFLLLSPPEITAALAAFRQALEGTEPLSTPVNLASVGRALFNPRLLGTPLLSTFPGRYRLLQAPRTPLASAVALPSELASPEQGLHRLVEEGEGETAQQFIKLATGHLLGIPTLPRSDAAVIAVRAILDFVEAASGPVAAVAPQLTLLGEGPALQLLGAARRILTGHEDSLPQVYCEYLYRRAMTEWQNEREHRALEGLFDCWSTIVRLQLAPCRLEARLLHNLLHLAIRVPGNLALAKHLSCGVYWFEETVEDHVDKALCLSTLGLAELAKRNLPSSLSFLDRAMATLQHVAPYGDCYRQLFVRPALVRAFVLLHANRPSSAVKDFKLALTLLKETCRVPDPFWDILYSARAQYLRVREKERGQQFHTTRVTTALFRTSLLSMRLVDLNSETPLRAHALTRTGEFYVALGRYGKAVACFEEAAQQVQGQHPRCFGPGHPYVSHLRALRDSAYSRATVPRPLHTHPYAPPGHGHGRGQGAPDGPAAQGAYMLPDVVAS
eukprot:tig00021179_g19239.t1